MLKEMSRIRSNSARLSAKTLQPALAARCLFVRCEGRPLAFFQTRAVLVTMRCPQKKDRLGRNNFLLILVFPDSIKCSFACRADPLFQIE